MSNESIFRTPPCNHILPFLWLREQEPRVLRQEIEKIFQSGIGAFCVESRPHPDFCGPGWWRDMDLILEEAKKRGMQVWILDDAHFPTGQANGMISRKYPERARQYIMMQYVDCVGPMPYASLDLHSMTHRRRTWMDLGKPVNKPLCEDVELLSVVAVPLVEGDMVSEQAISLTHLVQGDSLVWQVPPGVWRVCVSFTTYDFGAKNEYINYIDRDSVKALVEAVYELHYQKYASEFGKTIAGFFSDEPGFYNVDNYQMGNAIGRKTMALPWCRELREIYEAQAGPDWKEKLLYLWLEGQEGSFAGQRLFYMDQVSRLYSKNFSCQLGQWCKDHGVDYIGHVIEDFGEHTRLGCGAGHYFRAMAGQSYSGIDCIGGQILPGNPYATRHGPAGDCDGIFYHYGLAKLGASAAHLDPAKQGRCMCELFGAYGWSLGTKQMKWMLDELLFQGVNCLVPHAFSMAAYPDPDCPPHFYAGGHNPLYPYFGDLMRYANRLCELLSGGVSGAGVAVLYPAQQDWMGQVMPVQQAGRQLLEHQLDFEILSTDILDQPERFGVRCKPGKLTVNGQCLRGLVVLPSRFIDAGTLAHCVRLAKQQLPVIFVDALPQQVVEEGRTRPLSAGEKALFEVAALDALSEHLKARGIQDPDLRITGAGPNLLAYHYRTDRQILCLFNTSLSEPVKGTAYLRGVRGAVEYDAMQDCICLPAQRTEGEELAVEFELAPYQSLVLVEGDPADAPEKAAQTGPQVQDLSHDWQVSAVSCAQQPEPEVNRLMGELTAYSLTAPQFSGWLKYEKTLSLSEAPAQLRLCAQYVYDAAELFVNGVSAGRRLIPPYQWDIAPLLQTGDNLLRLEVATTPVRDSLRYPAPFDPQCEVYEPTGLFGKVGLYKTL